MPSGYTDTMRKRIHDFAAKWVRKLSESETAVCELLDNEDFLSECLDFGFEMGCGEAFIEQYSDEAFVNAEALMDIIFEVEDIELLGSAVLSRWGYFSNWVCDSEEISEADARDWFVCAFSRLAELTEEIKLKKITLVSNCIRYGPEPEPDDEIEQRLTICSDGQVRLSRYAYGGGFEEHKLIEEKALKISEDTAAYILKETAECCIINRGKFYVTDVGSWELSMIGEDGEARWHKGSLIPEGDRLQDLSDAIRLHLNMPELLCFDGRVNPDRIENIKIEYSRCTKIKPKNVPEGVEWEYITWDYSESIEIDRKSETIHHVQNIAQECSIKREYHVSEGVSAFLDNFDADNFLAVGKGNPPDAIHDPLDTRTYTITVSYMNREPRVIIDSFDKHGLPEDFPDFAEQLYYFMRFYGDGEILNPTVFGKTLRKQGELIFCNVQFDSFGKTYCYLTEDESIKAGDMLVVPAGPDNRETVVSVESVEYHTAEDAPFPIEKIKKVICKFGN